MSDEAAHGPELARRASDHYEPCGLLKVAQTEIINIKEDVAILYKRADRLPTWMVFLFSATTGALGAAITAVVFLAQELSKRI